MDLVPQEIIGRTIAPKCNDIRLSCLYTCSKKASTAAIPDQKRVAWVSCPSGWLNRGQAAPPPLRWRAEAFPVGEVQFPGYLDPHYSSYTKAALTHNIMPDTLEKIEFTFGLYMRTFFCDPTGLFFSMLEM